MKTKILLSTLFASLLIAANISAQNPSFEWVKQMNASNPQRGNNMTTDANGNVYTTGNFQGTVDFDPGQGNFNLTSEGGADIFIQKLDANGNFLWAKHMGGTKFDYGESIITDPDGNVYTTGNFIETVDFDPGPGIFNLTSASRDIFIQKLDANGNFIWVKQLVGSTYDYSYSINIDANRNVYTTGYFAETVDFDPGAGTSNLTSFGYSDIFIQKMDADGNFLWVKQMGGSGYDLGSSTAIDANGNVYTAGYFEETADFDPGSGTTNLTSVGMQDIFVQKLDGNGNLIWVKQIGGISIDIGSAITTDADGNVITTGRFAGTVDFDPGVGTTNLSAGGYSQVFVQKLDGDGDFIWAKQMGGALNDYGNSIITDANGNIYTIGIFADTADLDPGPGITNLISAGLYDIFIQKLDANGDLVWVTQFGGIGEERGESISIDASGNVYTTGEFSNTVDFDPGAGTTNLTSIGFTDIFIQKLSQTTTGLLKNSFSENFVVYPNPTDGKFSIEFNNIQESVTVRILSLTGQVIVNKQFQNTNNIQLELNQPNGIYFLETIDERGNRVALRIVKQ